MKYDVLGIGNAIVDILTHVDDEKLSEIDVPKGSMQLVDEVRSNAIYKQLGQCIECSGGSAANTIASLAALGCDTAFIGKVKRDQLGAVFKHDLKAIGTTFTSAPSTDGPSTAHSLVLVTPDAERTMCTYLGACVNLTEDDIDEDMIKDAKIIYLEGYLWDPEEAKKAFRKAIKIAHEAGNKVALSLSDSFCVDRHHTEFVELVKNDVDILFGNEEEIKILYGTDDLAEATKKLQEDVEIGVITCSAKGCIVTDSSGVGHIQGRQAARLVDTTGAGDNFAAGFLYGLTNGKSMGECGALGNLVASEVITHMGARPDIDLKRFIAENA